MNLMESIKGQKMLYILNNIVKRGPNMIILWIKLKFQKELKTIVQIITMIICCQTNNLLNQKLIQTEIIIINIMKNII